MKFINLFPTLVDNLKDYKVHLATWDRQQRSFTGLSSRKIQKMAGYSNQEKFRAQICYLYNFMRH